MKVIKTTNMEVSMMEQIEDHMKTHNISFAEFIRRAAASYLDRDLPVAHDSIEDSEQVVVNVEDTPNAINPKNDFNFDDLNID